MIDAENLNQITIACAKKSKRKKLPKNPNTWQYHLTTHPKIVLIAVSELKKPSALLSQIESGSIGIVQMSKQSTVNSQQSTVNSQQSAVNSQQLFPSCNQNRDRSCPNCQVEICRDTNAAINILNKGMGILGREWHNITEGQKESASHSKESMGENRL